MWNQFPEEGTFLSLLTLYILFFVVEIINDEEIHVLFKGMLCLRTLDVHTFKAV